MEKLSLSTFRNCSFKSFYGEGGEISKFTQMGNTCIILQNPINHWELPRWFSGYHLCSAVKTGHRRGQIKFQVNNPRVKKWMNFYLFHLKLMICKQKQWICWMVTTCCITNMQQHSGQRLVLRSCGPNLDRYFHNEEGLYNLIWPVECILLNVIPNCIYCSIVHL